MSSGISSTTSTLGGTHSVGRPAGRCARHGYFPKLSGSSTIALHLTVHANSARFERNSAVDLHGTSCFSTLRRRILARSITVTEKTHRQHLATDRLTLPRERIDLTSNARASFVSSIAYILSTS